MNLSRLRGGFSEYFSKCRSAVLELAIRSLTSLYWGTAVSNPRPVLLGEQDIRLFRVWMIARSLHRFAVGI